MSHTAHECGTTEICDLGGGHAARSEFLHEGIRRRGAEANEIISEISIAGGIIGIHSGGEGKRTWTGMSFQVPDVIAGAAEIVAAGGQLVREPQPEDGEPPHLAMCVDTEGNEIMLTRKRS